MRMNDVTDAATSATGVRSDRDAMIVATEKIARIVIERKTKKEGKAETRIENGKNVTRNDK